MNLKYMKISLFNDTLQEKILLFHHIIIILDVPVEHWPFFWHFYTK